MNLQTATGGDFTSSVKFLINPNLLLSAGLLACGFITWLWVLSEWDVSFAYPFLSLNLVVIMCASKLMFSETIKSHHWVGAFSIVAGVSLISGGGMV